MLTVMTYMVTTNNQGGSPEQEDKSYQRKAVTCQSTRSATLALPKQDAAAFEASSSSQAASALTPGSMPLEDDAMREPVPYRIR